MNGLVELYQACKKHGIKPIQGCEVYVTDDHTKRGKRHHPPRLHESAVGYRNLAGQVLRRASWRASSVASRRSTPGPQQVLEGVIAPTGCLASRFCQACRSATGLLRPGLSPMSQAQTWRACERFLRGAEERHPRAGQGQRGDRPDRARGVGRPPVGTGDVHYLRREDYDNHTALLCVQTKSTLAAPKMTFDTNEFYLRSSDEMADKFAEWPRRLVTTLEIVERRDVEIELGKQLIPRLRVPGRAWSPSTCASW